MVLLRDLATFFSCFTMWLMGWLILPLLLSRNGYELKNNCLVLPSLAVTWEVHCGVGSGLALLKYWFHTRWVMTRVLVRYCLVAWCVSWLIVLVF